jgi:hypothetical protein
VRNVTKKLRFLNRGNKTLERSKRRNDSKIAKFKTLREKQIKIVPKYLSTLFNNVLIIAQPALKYKIKRGFQAKLEASFGEFRLWSNYTGACIIITTRWGR